MFVWALRNSRLFRAGVVLLAPERVVAPDLPHSSPERIESLRQSLTELEQRVREDGASLLLVSVADPLHAAGATRRLAAELDLPALVLEHGEYKSFGIIPRESHWTADATAYAAARFADWIHPRLRRADHQQHLMHE